MPNYRRAWVPGGTYFFTVNLRDRRRNLLVAHVDLLRTAFRIARAARPFEMMAVVVLPEHLHCVWRLPIGDADHATRWRHIKTLFSQSVEHATEADRSLWQQRHWEHLIRDERDLGAHIDYVHINPVKHGHASRVADWPYSSFHRFVRQGALPQDWGGVDRRGAFGE